MFCSSCGRALAENLRFCDGCGADLTRGAVAQAVPLAEQLGTELKARSRDAWQGIKLFARSPVGGLPESFALFDDRRAVQVGVAFAVLYEAALFLGGLIFKSKGQSLMGGMLPIGELTASQMFKLVVLGLVPVASLIVAGTVASLIFRGSGRIAGDVYTAGAVLLPSGFLALLAALLGSANVEVILVLSLFALTYSILMLYAGCSRIGHISEAGAAPAVPIILLASAWITKIIVVAVW